MRVKVLFLGMLKDIAGHGAEELELERGSDVSTAFARCAERYPRLKNYEDSIVLARNHEFTRRSDPLADGDEVALLPPVSGGSGTSSGQEIVDPSGDYYALTRHPIQTDALVERILEGRDGAVVRFEGVVRDNTKGRPTLRLDYECYEPMALKVMAGIGRELVAEKEISRIAMVHRLGLMEIGETSVAIVVCAPHRKQAFDAALDAINRLKRLVPIWKKEHFADGEVWVEGEWDESVLR